jgi:hypothetical protein
LSDLSVRTLRNGEANGFAVEKVSGGKREQEIIEIKNPAHGAGFFVRKQLIFQS